MENLHQDNCLETITENNDYFIIIYWFPVVYSNLLLSR